VLKLRKSIKRKVRQAIMQSPDSYREQRIEKHGFNFETFAITLRPLRLKWETKEDGEQGDTKCKKTKMVRNPNCNFLILYQA
jgi:hypothetical protein